MEIEVGQQCHANFGGKETYKIHVLAIVADDMVVYKYYGKHKQRWFYEIKSREQLQLYIKLEKDKKE